MILHVNLKYIKDNKNHLKVVLDSSWMLANPLWLLISSCKLFQVYHTTVQETIDVRPDSYRITNCYVMRMVFVIFHVTSPELSLLNASYLECVLYNLSLNSMSWSDVNTPCMQFANNLRHHFYALSTSTSVSFIVHVSCLQAEMAQDNKLFQLIPITLVTHYMCNCILFYPW